MLLPSALGATGATLPNIWFIFSRILRTKCWVHPIEKYVVFVLRAADIPEEEARYWAKKLEQLNAMRDQDVSSYPYLLIHLVYFETTTYSKLHPMSYFPHAHLFI